MMLESARKLDPAPAPRGILSASVLGRADGRLEGRRVLPSRELAAFVHHYWSVHWQLRAPFTAETLPHPAARIELEEQNGAMRAEVTGVRTGCFAKRLTGSGQFFGVQFRPAAFQQLLRAPMASLTNRVVPVAQLLGDDANAWVRALQAEPAFEAKFALTEAFLRTLLPTLRSEVARMRDLVERIAVDHGLRCVEQAAEAFGTDVRTLQRRFRYFVGVHPKWVLQRYRLIEAAAQLQAAQPPKLSALAASLGYADQAHFQREFRVVIGKTPGSFARHWAVAR
jgi:AraC-like DNA-binding protein